MATGRTHQRYLRYYQGGYDLSGEARSVGMLGAQDDSTTEAALSWEIKGALPGIPTIVLPPLNTILRFDTTAADSPHDWLKGMDATAVKVMIPIGIRAAPAAGDYCFQAVNWQKNYKISEDGNMLTATVEYDPSYTNGNTTPANLTFSNPWGVLLHAKSAETAANSAVGIDGGAATALGAEMMVQIFAVAGSGTVTIKVQDAAINQNASFADVASLTSGAVADTSVPCAITAATATTASIRQYTRWQIALVGITSVTFALSLVRGK